MNAAMTRYVQTRLELPEAEANALRVHYWRRYGSTLAGLMRHHGVRPHDFLHETHRFAGLEARVTGQRHDLACLQRFRGLRVLLTNAPRDYTARVLSALRISHSFDHILCIEDLTMFGHWRPKPDARMMRRLAAKLKAKPQRCTLVEDSLVNQKGAKKVGMQTVWMQRFARRGNPHGPRAARWLMRPPYVGQTVRRLSQIRGKA
jgi:putative hydrolase of the HAD superfamily